jgi:GTP-binding protein YchF
VVRAFRDPAVPHPRGSIDPARDLRTIEDELVLADLGGVERRIERLEKDLKKGQSADLRAERELLARCQSALEAGQPLRGVAMSGDDRHRLRGFQFLSAKPLLVVINLDDADAALAEDAARIAGVAGLGDASGAAAVGVCAKIELEIAALEAADAQAFLADLGLSQSGLDRIIRAAYDLLGYISFFTVGEDECRAWSIPRALPAQLAAGAIHSDIQRGFIRAEVVGCDRLLDRGSLAACRDAGELRLEGKDYLVVDGDVINFRHAT